jgi:hypothetical protein
VAALVMGSLLAVAALAYVMMPLLRGVRTAPPESPLAVSPESTAVDALREIEFDRETGKLSDEDYATLKATYTPRALQELRVREAKAEAERALRTDSGAAETTRVNDAVEEAAEALIARARARALHCAECGPRPESDALFCSNCGRVLGAACLRCGADVESTTSRFCGVCGESLAA